jgi:protein-L-isoaspartate(D-aspartate) O-methyltransferase
MNESDFVAMRQLMLVEIAASAIYTSAQLGKAALDRRVLDVMAKVPRHEFVPIELQPYAYANFPLPIGFGKTISQPFIVALMTDLLEIAPTDRVLEIGTGLGYQTAILSKLAQQVYSIEIIEELAVRARQKLARRGHECRNPGQRWQRRMAEHAPLTGVTAAPSLSPTADLPAQNLGNMAIPAGLADAQQLMVVAKDASRRVDRRHPARAFALRNPKQRVIRVRPNSKRNTTTSPTQAPMQKHYRHLPLNCGLRFSINARRPSV